MLNYPRIALKCPSQDCRRVLCETDTRTRLYFGEHTYIERTSGRVTVHCAHCAARGIVAAVHWTPRAAVELEPRVRYTERVEA
jgi:hypothetical protein